MPYHDPQIKSGSQLGPWIRAEEDPGLSQLTSRSSFQNVGSPNVPQEIRRLRRENLDLCRKMGQPVVFRHMWNLEDIENGLAKKCPVCFDEAYQQVRNNCHACFGVGFVSVELKDNTYYLDSSGDTKTGSANSTGIQASLYGGFGLPQLTWMVEPDVSVDVFRINEQGVMIRTYDAQGVAPWFPQLGDNDLCINVTLDATGQNITGENGRYQLKQVQQVTLRGFGKKNASLGNPYQIAQTFNMARVPELGSNILNQVPREV